MNNNQYINNNQYYNQYHQELQCPSLQAQQSIPSTISPYTYIIYTDGTTIYAQNGFTGNIDYYGTDLSAIINSTITSLPIGETGGGLIHVRSGLYPPSAQPINIDGFKPIILEGEGISTKLQINSGDAINITNSFVTIRNMWINGNFSASAPHRAIVLDNNPHHTIIQNVRIENFDIGIECHNGFDNSISDTYIRNIKSIVLNLLDGIGFNINNVFYDTDNCTNDSCPSAPIGMFLKNISGVVVTNSDFIRASNCIVIQPDAGLRSGDHLFSNFYCDSGYNGTALTIRGTGTVNRIFFNNVWFATFTTGILIDGTNTVSGIRFGDCITWNHRNEGIRITNPNATDIIFHGGEVSGNNAINGNANQIYINNAKGIEIRDIRFTANFSFPAYYKPYDHIYIDSNAKNILITNNWFDNLVKNKNVDILNGTETQAYNNFVYINGVWSHPISENWTVSKLNITGSGLTMTSPNGLITKCVSIDNNGNLITNSGQCP